LPAYHRRVPDLHPAGGRIPQHQLGCSRQAAQARQGVSLVAEPDSELLDGIGKGTGIEVTQGLKLFRGQCNLLAVPAIDWSWPPKQLNGVLCALFEEIALDPVTFQPVRYSWRVPEWRGA